MGLRIREDYRSISGPEKSAILLMSLGEDQAGKLFALLDDEEIKEISQVMAGLGTVSSNIVERLFVEFAEQLSSTGSLVGSMDSTQRLLTKILGEDRVNDVLRALRDGTPPIVMRRVGSMLCVDPMTLQAGEEEIVGERLRTILSD